jgi:hypothetical protein
MALQTAAFNSSLFMGISSFKTLLQNLCLRSGIACIAQTITV